MTVADQIIADPSAPLRRVAPALLRYTLFVVVPAAGALLLLRFGRMPAGAIGHPAGASGAPPAVTDRTLFQLLVAIAVIVGCAHLVGGLAERFGQPRVLGEMVAGVALGPSLLGALAPGLSHLLFPPGVHAYLSMLAELGVIFFMFLVGIELPMSALRAGRSTALLIGHAAIAVPLLLGVVTGMLMPASYRGDSGGVVFVAFIGLCMSITAFPVLARILSDRKLTRTPLGVMGMAAAGIADISAWCALTVVAAAARGQSAVGVALAIGATVAFSAVMWWVIRPLLRIVVERYGESARHGVMVLMLFLVLLSALTTDRLGMHSVFGAFLAGLVIPRGPRVVEDFSVRMEGLTVWLLLPLFFAVVGLGVHFDRLGVDGWLLLLVVTAVGIVGKMFGSTVPARLAGMPMGPALRLGYLMNCRGITEVVMLDVGVSLGIIGHQLFTVLVGMASLTTLMTGPLLALRRRSVSERGAGPLPRSRPDETSLWSIEKEVA